MPMGVVFIKKCDGKGGGGGGGQKVNVIVTLRSAKVVWKCPLSILYYSTSMTVMLMLSHLIMQLRVSLKSQGRVHGD